MGQEIARAQYKIAQYTVQQTFRDWQKENTKTWNGLKLAQQY
jgi:hypothetical protein